MASFFNTSFSYSCSNRIRLEILLDLENLIGSQAEFCRAHDLICLGRFPRHSAPLRAANAASSRANACAARLRSFLSAATAVFIMRAVYHGSDCITVLHCG